MANFRKTAGRVAGLAAGRAKSLAALAAKKTKNVSRIARLNVEIAGERDTIKCAYSEIGKLYFETHRGDPEGFFVQLCQEIETALEHITALEAEIVRLKTEDFSAAQGEEAAPDVEVEIVEEPLDGAPDASPEDASPAPSGSAPAEETER